MSPSFSYIFLLLLLLLESLQFITARKIPRFIPEPTVIPARNHTNTWHELGRFQDLGRGSHITGMHVTGNFDSSMLSKIASPRCGVSDIVNVKSMHATRNYVLFPGKPRWARRIPITLTYAFSPDHLINYLSLNQIRAVFNRSFTKWASVIPVNFSEIIDYASADIKIGFYNGDHGDGEPFDGVLGVLAHAFSPESGKFHLDAAERWAVDFESENSMVAVDLESVATHEIGHVLGLGHSTVEESIMYPSLKPRHKKVDLKVDDIKGVQALYGSNPNFSYVSLLESDMSSNQAVDFRVVSSSYWATSMMIISILFFVT